MTIWVLWLAILGGFVLGYTVCAVMTMGRLSDQADAQYGNAWRDTEISELRAELVTAHDSIDRLKRRLREAEEPDAAALRWQP
jgi:hypothetical protein